MLWFGSGIIYCEKLWMGGGYIENSKKVIHAQPQPRATAIRDRHAIWAEMTHDAAPSHTYSSYVYSMSDGESYVFHR